MNGLTWWEGLLMIVGAGVPVCLIMLTITLCDRLTDGREAKPAASVSPADEDYHRHLLKQLTKARGKYAALLADGYPALAERQLACIRTLEAEIRRTR
jgi:hypothetical protein